MKTIKKLLIVMLIAIIGLINIQQSVEADTPTKLVVHYHRFDPAYAGWQLWLWAYEPTPGDGANYNFNGEDSFGKYMEINLAGTSLEGATSVGVIVKTSSWDKDVALDRFMDLTNPNELGEVHVYLVSGDPTIYYDDSAVDISDRASNVNFEDINTISFDASIDVVLEDITLLEDGVPAVITNFLMFNGHGSFDLPSGADLTKTYSLEIEFDPLEDPKEYVVGLGGLYTSDEFNAAYGYDGELGAIYSETETTFKLWAPVSQEITLNLYEYGHKANETDYSGQAGTNTPYAEHDLVYIGQGVWEVTVSGDLHGKYYTYEVTNGAYTNEVTDPYAFSTGINGRRGMIVDFERLNPDNWVAGVRPDTIQSYNDSIITEIHVRDYTTHSSWNGTDDYRGKFLGLVETGTTYQGVTTGFDHIVELGVTHVQLLPVFDFGAAVDETRILDEDYTGKKDTVFNWGYMPQNFNALEGSFSTDPYDGEARVTEFKTLVQSFHDEDIRVVMDVVYNHHGQSADSNFDLIVPGYYFRMNENGSFSNGSGTGNETASEHYMMSKFMIDSVVFWAEEYNVSGFRFDLMKLHDAETMAELTSTLHEIDPTILVYGEPWDAGGSQLPEDESAYKGTLDQMPGVAVFSDDARDGIKGSVFDEATPGFIQGASDGTTMERIRMAITGSANVVGFNTPGGWAPNPNQTINYATAHDNNVLLDKIMLSTTDITHAQAQNMVKQAGGIVLLSNGIPFLHGGVEIMRTKPCVVIGGENQGECDATASYDHNSYRSPDETNQINWQWKVDNINVFEYYKGLIELRKANPNFRLDSIEEMESKMTFIPESAGTIQYLMFDGDNPWAYIMVAHNNSDGIAYIDLLGLEWNVVVNDEYAGTEVLEVVSGTYQMEPSESVVMYISNPNYIDALEVVTDLTTPLLTEDYSSENMFDDQDLIDAIVVEIGTGTTVTIDSDIDYEVEGTYDIEITVEDENDVRTTKTISINVVVIEAPEPGGNENLVTIIIAVVAGIALIGGGLFIAFKPRL